MSRDGSREWLSTTIGEVADVRTGGTPSRKCAEYWNGSIPWMASGEIHEKYVSDTAEFVTDEGLKNSNASVLPVNSVMLALNGQGKTRGKAAILRRAMACNQSLAAIIPKWGNVPEYFLFYLESQYRELRRLTGDNARNGLNLGLIRNCPILLPPPAEQRRIAEILSSVDEAIQATQAVIEQTRKVKEGVLLRLLTRGIGCTRFKQTEIGEIPEGWSLVNLESLLAEVDSAMRSGPFGSALLKEELVEEGIPLLGIDNVHIERFDRRFKRFVTPQKYQQLRRYAVRPNDVMITIMGTVGRCCVVPDDLGPALSSKHVWTLTFDDARYLPDLLCWQLNFAPWALQEFMRSAQGGVMSAINSSVLRGVRVPVPPMDEQRHIHAALLAFNATIAAEEERLIALNTSKTALMADLLTGRRRVSTTLLLAAE